MEEKGATARNTKQKNLILNCLISSQNAHMTADEVVDDLKARGTPVARSTVYRFLAHLEENGDVRKYITAEGSPVCYQFIDKSIGCAEHYHLMCKECGDIVHFENKKLEKLLRDIRDASDGQRLIIDGPRTVFYGTCGKCASS